MKLRTLPILFILLLAAYVVLVAVAELPPYGMSGNPSTNIEGYIENAWKRRSPQHDYRNCSRLRAYDTMFELSCCLQPYCSDHHPKTTERRVAEVRLHPETGSRIASAFHSDGGLYVILHGHVSPGLLRRRYRGGTGLYRLYHHLWPERAR